MLYLYNKLRTDQSNGWHKSHTICLGKLLENKIYYFIYFSTVKMYKKLGFRQYLFQGYITIISCNNFSKVIIFLFVVCYRFIAIYSYRSKGHSPTEILLEEDTMSSEPVPQYFSAPVSAESPVLDTRRRSPVHPVVWGTIRDENSTKSWGNTDQQAGGCPTT